LKGVAFMATPVYNRKFFSVLREMSRFYPQFVINKEGDQLVTRQQTEDTGIHYIIKAPENYFQFLSKQVAFYNYPEFYQFFDLFEKPVMSFDGNKIILEGDGTKAEYFFSNFESCKDSVSKEELDKKWKEPEVGFLMTATDLDFIVKASSLFTSDEKRKKIRVSGNNKEVNIELVNQNINPKKQTYDKTFSKKFAVKELKEFSGDYKFIIDADFFINCPKRDYAIEIKKSGFVRSSFKEDDISVDIFTGYIRERN
jgi:hypothetical protein